MFRPLDSVTVKTLRTFYISGKVSDRSLLSAGVELVRICPLPPDHVVLVSVHVCDPAAKVGVEVAVQMRILTQQEITAAATTNCQINAREITQNIELSTKQANQKER